MMVRDLLKKSFFIPILLITSILFNGVAYSSSGGFSQFLDKTVGSVEKPQPQRPETQALPGQNNQSTDTWTPHGNNGGYYDDKNTSSFSNNPLSQNNRKVNNTVTERSPLPTTPPINTNESSSAYTGTFPQNYAGDNSFSDSEKGGGINTDIPAGVNRFRSQRDQNIYLDGIQDYVDGLVDRDGNPIEQSRIGKVQKPSPDYNKTYNQKHKRK